MIWVNLNLAKTVLKVRNLTIRKEGHGHQTLDDISFDLREGEVLCIGGIEGNGQSELVYAITGLLRDYQGQIILNDKDITNSNIRFRNINGIAQIPEDRHKYGLVLDYTLEQNLIMQSYFEPEFQRRGLIKFAQIADYADRLIEQYDIRSGQGRNTLARSMSRQSAKSDCCPRMERRHNVLIAVQPTRVLMSGPSNIFINKYLNTGRKVSQYYWSRWSCLKSSAFQIAFWSCTMADWLESLTLKTQQSRSWASTCRVLKRRR